MLFLSLILTKDQKYLLGSTSEGEIYVWLFEEILMEYLNEKVEGDNIFSHICSFKLTEGKIFNLRLDENNLDRLFFNDDYFLYSFNWTDLLSEIKERRQLGYPATKVTRFAEHFRTKFNINQEFGEQVNKITSVDYDFKGKTCFVGTNKGTLMAIDVDSFTVLKLATPVKTTISLEDNALAITAIKHYRDAFVAFGNAKGLIQLWNWEGDKEVKTFRLEKESLSPVKCIETDKEGRWLVVGHNDYITWWHVESGVLTTAMPVVATVNSLLVGNLSLYSAHDNKCIYQWNEKGELLTKAEASVDAVTTIIGDVDGKEKIVISGGSGPLIDVYLNSSRIISF